jgi:hypothetical protein
MKNPTRERNVSLLILLLGALFVGYFFRFRNKTDILPDIAGLIGALALMGGFVFFLIVAFDARRYNRLRRGRNIIARWSLSPDEWHAFVNQNHALNQTAGTLGFRIPRGHIPRTTPVEIIVGDDSLFIDNDFHSLPHNGLPTVWGPQWCEGPPPYLEFLLREPGAEGADPSDAALRLPVTPNSLAQARTVYDYYDSHLAASKGKPPPPLPEHVTGNLSRNS